MKKVISFVLVCVITLTVLPTFVFAESANIDIDHPGLVMLDHYTEQLNGNLFIVHSVTLTERGYNSKTATHTENFYASGILIATIAIQATFHYDGNNVSVASKSVTQASTYNGWNYTQNSFTSSGGTVTLSGTLSKFLHSNQVFSMSLSCDKDGNVSAT